MKTNTTTIIILLAAAGLGYYLWTKRRKTAADLGAAAGSAAATAAVNTAGQILTGAGGGTTGTTGSGTTGGKITFTETERNSLLSNGKTGNTVKALQSYLKKAGKNIGAAGVDGVFGADTERALNDQEDKKTITLKELDVTGYDITTEKVYGREWGYQPEGVLFFSVNGTPYFG